jgi:hypothetical protein
MLYSFFWEIPRRLNFIFSINFRRRGITQKKEYNNGISIEKITLIMHLHTLIVIKITTTNDSIRRELQTDNILDKIDEYRRNWLLQLQRMLQNRIHLKSFYYTLQGKRTIGRPKKRWERATVTLETERANWPNPGCL